VGSRPAHHARVALHGVELHPAPAENPDVGFVVELVAVVQPGRVQVQSVGVLHQEFPGAQDPALGAGFVPQLGLDLIPDLGEVPVGPDLPRGQPGDDLFVGHPQNHVPLVPVFEAEHLLPDVIPPSGLLPDFGGVENGHGDLLPADGVHFFPDDAVHLFQGTEPQG
jgi:hypothetical protein